VPAEVETKVGANVQDVGIVVAAYEPMVDEYACIYQWGASNGVQFAVEPRIQAQI
jgi:hypothetical protein